MNPPVFRTNHTCGWTKTVFCVFQCSILRSKLGVQRNYFKSFIFYLATGMIVLTETESLISDRPGYNS